MTTNPFLSRKFLLTLLFTAIVMANAYFKMGVTWEQLTVLAATFGVYDVTNVIKAIGTPVVEEAPMVEDETVDDGSEG
jgi:hypothetical protein